MTLPKDAAKIRELSNAVHAAAQGARVTDTRVDVPAVLDDVSDALRHLLSAVEELQRRIQRLESMRRRCQPLIAPTAGRGSRSLKA